MFSVSSGINYSSYSYLFGEYVGQLRLDYLEVPLLIKAGTSVGPVRPFIIGGPILGFRIMAEARAQGSSTTGIQPVIDAKYATNPMAVGLAGGAGLEYPLSTWISIYGLGWHMKGMTDVDKSDSTTTTVSGFQMLGGVQFSIL